MGRSDVDGVVRTRMWRFRRVAGRYVNPVTRRVAGKLPAFGVLTHRGRKTGRTYRTPVNVFRRGDLYVFFLTYGSNAQWVKNVIASGACSLETRGRVVELVEPELITDARAPARAARRPLRGRADRRCDAIPADAPLVELTSVSQCFVTPGLPPPKSIIRSVYVERLFGNALGSSSDDFVIVQWKAAVGDHWIAPLHVHHRDDEAWYVL